VSLTLPDELVWVLDLLGFNWPMADEDQLKEAAKAWRQFADDADDVRREAAQVVRHVVGANEAEAIDAFAQHWKEFERGDDGHLSDAADAARLVADVLDGFADAVLTMKGLVLAQVVICAAQIATAVAAAPVTGGASLVASAGVTQGIRLVVRKIISEGMDQIQRQFINQLKRRLPELFQSILKASSRKVDDAARSLRAVPTALRRGGPRRAEMPPGRRRASGPPRRADAPGSNRPVDARKDARANDKRCTGGDPVDLATGEVLHGETDIDLPGALPLVLDRTHRSSYRAGRWFGPTWASTLDQRLELDDAGVCFVAADGMLLVYPPPEVGSEVLPEEGPRWPLRLTEDGEYAILDPDTGRTLRFEAVTDPFVLPLSSISDRNGHCIDLRHDDSGLLVEIAHSGGVRIGVETSDGLIVALRLLTGGEHTNLVRFGYGEGRRLTEVTNSSGLALSFDYDPAGRMTRWEDRNGVWYRYDYDDYGRCIRGSGSDGCMDNRFTYDTVADASVTVMTDSLGHESTFHFNDRYQLVRSVDPLGTATASEWDRYDRLLARTDPLGRTTRYVYDDGNLVAVIRPDGAEVTAEYNDLGLPVRIVEPDGAEWRHEYDARGNLTAFFDPIGATTTYDYDDRGHLFAVTNALGNSRYVETDDAGLLVTVTDPLGSVAEYGRDAFGRVVTVTDPAGGVTKLAWTVEGKLASRTLPDGATERWTYDGEGNVVQYVDALGQATVIEIGNFDLPTAETGPDGARIEFAYDTELRLTAVTNAQGLVWRYEYDAAGRLERETDFNGRELSYAHDAAGQLARRVNGVGETTDYARDLLGNVVEQRSGDAAATFTYDRAGRMVVAENGDASLVFERDRLGRVVAEICNDRALTSEYDLLGRRVRRRTPTGAESTWAYDARDQPMELKTAGRSVFFAYDVAGRETERLVDATTIAQSWDVNSRLHAQTVSATRFKPAHGTLAREDRLVQRRSYAYREDGYVSSIEDHLSGDRRFDLDRAGRVTAVQGNGWTERYAYDPAGNTTHADWPAPSGSGSDDADARGDREYAGTLIRRAGNVRYENDAEGRVVLRQQKRLSSKPRTWRYRWDANDRMVGLTAPDDQQWRYRYDPLGRRIAKERMGHDGTTVVERVDFTWDGVVLAEQTHTGSEAGGSGTTVWDWEPGAFRPVSQAERRPADDALQEWVDEQFYAIVTDLVGTPTELVGPDGSVASHTRRTLWGSTVEQARVGGDCPLRFPGQYFDRESGLHYNFFRYYEPATARYESGDPLGLSPGPNPYGYVPNPTKWIDPFGLRGGDCNQRVPRSAAFADTDLLIQAQRGHAGALSELRAGPTYVTPNQFNEFVAGGPGRRAFLEAEGIGVFTGPQAGRVASGTAFQKTFQSIVGAQGRGDAALAAFARQTGFEAITMDRRLVNFIRYTLQDPSIPIRQIPL